MYTWFFGKLQSVNLLFCALIWNEKLVVLLNLKWDCIIWLKRLWEISSPIVWFMCWTLALLFEILNYKFSFRLIELWFGFRPIFQSLIADLTLTIADCRCWPVNVRPGWTSILGPSLTPLLEQQGGAKRAPALLFWVLEQETGAHQVKMCRKFLPFPYLNHFKSNTNSELPIELLKWISTRISK